MDKLKNLAYKAASITNVPYAIYADAFVYPISRGEAVDSIVLENLYHKSLFFKEYNVLVNEMNAAEPRIFESIEPLRAASNRFSYKVGDFIGGENVEVFNFKNDYYLIAKQNNTYSVQEFRISVLNILSSKNIYRGMSRHDAYSRIANTIKENNHINKTAYLQLMKRFSEDVSKVSESYTKKQIEQIKQRTK